MDLIIAGQVLPIDLLVFDCDGVLLDTMPAKIRAFSDWVPEAHAVLKPVFMKYIMHSFGRSRTFHVDYFYRELAGESPEPAWLEAEVARFGAICEPLCAAADWRPGSRQFVETCQQAGIPRYVLSGTPQTALEDMLHSNGAERLFDGIIGSPPGKPESMERILRETNIPAERTVFVGDAHADWEAARHVGAHFVYFPSQAERPKGVMKTEVANLRELMV